jgi:hypothetical protein
LEVRTYHVTMYISHRFTVYTVLSVHTVKGF